MLLSKEVMMSSYVSFHDSILRKDYHKSVHLLILKTQKNGKKICKTKKTQLPFFPISITLCGSFIFSGFTRYNIFFLRESVGAKRIP